MIKELKTEEVKLLKPLMEYLAMHHNNVSTYFKGCFPLHKDEDRIARFEKEISEGTSKAYVCLEGELIVGVIKIDFNDDKGVIDYFVILKEYQGKGYGKALMDKALETFNEKNIIDIELHVVYGNDAVKFYEKYGFKIQSYVMELKENDNE